MKLTHMISAVTVALLFSAGSAQAADAAGKFSVRGVGSTPCSAFVAAINSKDEAALNRYASWVMGYVSAYNRQQDQTFDALPTGEGKDFLALTLGVCQASPNDRLEQAVFSGLRGLNEIRLTSDSAMVTLTGDGKTLAIREETLRYLERKMKALGYYKGQETGKPSPQIVQAIKAFQTEQKIQATGLPNFSTLLTILRQK